jgi:hypothetical protein
MRKPRFSQQTIVFGIFVVLFAGFALFLPGFFSPDNMIALLQNVAVLGILSLTLANFERFIGRAEYGTSDRSRRSHERFRA